MISFKAKPLIAFEQERHPLTGQRILTCILLPQNDPSTNRYTSSLQLIFLLETTCPKIWFL